MKIDWNEEWSVGHDLLDHQHRQLLKLVQNAIDCAYDNSVNDGACFCEILEKVAAYAKTHFATEEALLQQIRYERLDDQLTEHQAFNRQLDDFLNAQTNGKDSQVDFAHFLSYWWSDHILQNDMQYKPLMAGV